MRVRTITEAVKELKKEDPKTALGYNTLSVLVKNGSIPSIKSGNRVLIDLDTLEAMLSRGINND